MIDDDDETVFVDCPNCDGWGEIYDDYFEDEIECPFCEGTGVVEEQDFKILEGE